MGTKSVLSKVLRIIAILYALFVLIYGSIFVSIDLSNTINYESVMKMEQGKLIQILFSGVCIIMGIALLTIIIIDYVLKVKYLKIYEGIIYPALLSVCSVILLIGFVVITVLIKETSLILLTILPTICMMVYAGYLIYKNKTNIKNTEENN